MASNTKVKLKLQAFQALRTTAEVESVTQRAAMRVAAAAGPGFEVKRADLRQRYPRFFVVPTTPEAYRANVARYAVLQGAIRASE